MSKRSEFIKDVFHNGKTKTWAEYAKIYDLRDDKQANDYYRWFIKSGAVEGIWEPDSVREEFNDVESLSFNNDYNDSIINDNKMLEDINLINSPLWQEFIDYKKSKKKTDFISGKHLVLPCVHSPFDNKNLMESVLSLISNIKPEGLHIIGDFLDMNSLSSHDKGNIPIQGITLDYEYNEGNILLDKILNAGNFKTKSFVSGNHESRYAKHMSKVDNAKYGNALLDPFTALKLEERGFMVEKDWQQGVVYLGKYLELCHGNFYNVHSAKKHIDVYRTSVVYAHTHRIQSYIEGNTGGYNIGWMGNANSPAFNYATRSQKETWNNGFAIINIDDDGFYFLEQIIWQNNKFYYGGKKY